VSELLPLFPLHTVLFPGVVMPLRVFEPRYRRLLEDLSELPATADRQFGVVAIKAGCEVGQGGGQQIQRVGCAALVTGVTANPDGTYEVVVVGRRRFLVEEVRRSRDYLTADVEWLGDPGGAPPDGVASVVAAARSTFDEYRARMRRLRGDDVLDGETPQEPVDLSYTIAAAAMIGIADRQRLLECPDVASRLEMGTAFVRAELRAMRAVSSLPGSSRVPASWSPN
jgi:uncharacterized protein